MGIPDQVRNDGGIVSLIDKFIMASGRENGLLMNAVYFMTNAHNTVLYIGVTNDMLYL